MKCGKILVTLTKTKKMPDDMHKKRIDKIDETFRWIY